MRAAPTLPAVVALRLLPGNHDGFCALSRGAGCWRMCSRTLLRRSSSDGLSRRTRLPLGLRGVPPRREQSEPEARLSRPAGIDGSGRICLPPGRQNGPAPRLMVAVPGSHAKCPPPGSAQAVVYFRVPQRTAASLTGDCYFPNLLPARGDEQPQGAQLLWQRRTEISS